MRIFIVHSFWVDDAFSIVALILTTAFFALSLDSLYNHSLGVHVNEITDLGTIEAVTKSMLIGGIIYGLATVFIKLSFGLTLQRFLQETWHKIVLYFTLFAVGATTIASIGFKLGICTPLSYTWTQATDPYLVYLYEGLDPDAAGLKPRGKCHSGTSLTKAEYSSTSIIMVADFVLGVVLPVLLLHELNMRTRLKALTGLLLSLGALAVLGSIARLVYLHWFESVDLTYWGLPQTLWGELELTLCIIGTSMTTLKPLVKKLGIFGDGDGPGQVGAQGHNNNSPPKQSSMKQKAMSWLNGGLSVHGSEATKSGASSGEAYGVGRLDAPSNGLDVSYEKSGGEISVIANPGGRSEGSG